MASIYGARSLHAEPIAPTVETARQYGSADAMLERYLLLRLASETCRRVWPDAQNPLVVATRDRDSPQERVAIELGDMGVCLTRAQLTCDERLVLRHLYRQRARWCQRCRRGFPLFHEGTHCPRCGAGRRQGWSYELMPTIGVLAEELSKRTKQRWSYWRVYRIRDAAFKKIEEAMRARGLLRG